MYCNTDKKENQIFLIRKFRMEQLQSHIWLTASSCRGKICAFPHIYDFATAALWIYIYNRTIWFSFLSVQALTTFSAIFFQYSAQVFEDFSRWKRVQLRKCPCKMKIRQCRPLFHLENCSIVQLSLYGISRKLLGWLRRNVLKVFFILWPGRDGKKVGGGEGEGWSTLYSIDIRKKPHHGCGG